MDPISEIMRDPSQLGTNPILLGCATAFAIQKWKEASTWPQGQTRLLGRVFEHRHFLPFLQFFGAMLLGIFATFVFLGPEKLGHWQDQWHIWAGGGGIAQVAYTIMKTMGVMPSTTQLAATSPTALGGGMGGAVGGIPSSGPPSGTPPTSADPRAG